MSSCLFVDANLGAPRVCVVACKRTVAVVVAVEVAVPIAVAGAEPRSSSRSGTSRAAIHCGLSGFWIFGVFGVWMFWTSVVEFGSPNMFWILVLSSCVGSWTSHSALELGFLILLWNLVLSARISHSVYIDVNTNRKTTFPPAIIGHATTSAFDVPFFGGTIRTPSQSRDLSHAGGGGTSAAISGRGVT